MDRGAWWATVQGVSKSQTRLSDLVTFILSLPPIILIHFLAFLRKLGHVSPILEMERK